MKKLILLTSLITLAFTPFVYAAEVINDKPVFTESDKAVWEQYKADIKTAQDADEYNQENYFCFVQGYMTGEAGTGYVGITKIVKSFEDRAKDDTKAQITERKYWKKLVKAAGRNWKPLVVAGSCDAESSDLDNN